MSTAALTHDSQEHHGAPAATCKFGMIIFLISEAMLFAGLLGGYIVLRISLNGFPWQAGHAWPPSADIPHLPVFLTSINTVFLLASSFTFHFSEVAVNKGKSGLGWLAVTIFLGSLFVGLQCYEWTHLSALHSSYGASCVRFSRNASHHPTTSLCRMWLSTGTLWTWSGSAC